MTRYPAGPAGRFGPYDLFGAARAILALVKNVAQRFENRRAVTRLLEWDDNSLKDIGLTRADVELSLGLPLSKDPSLQLVDWVAERRAAARSRGYDGPRLRVAPGEKRLSSASISRW